MLLDVRRVLAQGGRMTRGRMGLLAVAGAALAVAAYAAWPCRLPTPWPIEIVGGLCRTFPVRARPVTAGVGPPFDLALPELLHHGATNGSRVSEDGDRTSCRCFSAPRALIRSPRSSICSSA
ncbi:MAG: hypothetical protein A2V77_12335 [Anaeromyxobacter sp. RBG_16_69_14]|nr:MAG: hypothetical protein A2V77_12335 [Anaeromyxobacter sp. RBG_16_69_14]